MIYFDNSATTFVDPKVLETFNKVKKQNMTTYLKKN